MRVTLTPPVGEVYFERLREGDPFDLFGDLYIKITPVEGYNAVRLFDGHVYSVQPNAVVIPRPDAYIANEPKKEST